MRIQKYKRSRMPFLPFRRMQTFQQVRFEPAGHVFWLFVHNLSKLLASCRHLFSFFAIEKSWIFPFRWSQYSHLSLLASMKLDELQKCPREKTAGWHPKWEELHVRHIESSVSLWHKKLQGNCRRRWLSVLDIFCFKQILRANFLLDNFFSTHFVTMTHLHQRLHKFRGNYCWYSFQWHARTVSLRLILQFPFFFFWRVVHSNISISQIISTLPSNQEIGVSLVRVTVRKNQFFWLIERKGLLVSSIVCLHK